MGTHFNPYKNELDSSALFLLSKISISSLEYCSTTAFVNKSQIVAHEAMVRKWGKVIERNGDVCYKKERMGER